MKKCFCRYRVLRSLLVQGQPGDVLKGLDLDIERGEFCVLLGRPVPVVMLK